MIAKPAHLFYQRLSGLKTEIFAILELLCNLLLSVIGGITLSIIELQKIKKFPTKKDKNLAIAGIVIGAIRAIYEIYVILFVIALRLF